MWGGQVLTTLCKVEHRNVVRFAIDMLGYVYFCLYLFLSGIYTRWVKYKLTLVAVFGKKVRKVAQILQEPVIIMVKL